MNEHDIYTDAFANHPNTRIAIFDPYFRSAVAFENAHGEHRYDVAQAKLYVGDRLLTTQISLINVAWDYDYTIYIVNLDGKLIKVENGMPDVVKELRKAHNIYKLWVSGALGNNLR